MTRSSRQLAEHYLVTLEGATAIAKGAAILLKNINGIAAGSTGLITTFLPEYNMFSVMFAMTNNSVTFTDATLEDFNEIFDYALFSDVLADMDSCNHENQQEPHYCPFSVDVRQDYTPCTCCDFCETECAMNI